MPRAFYLGLNMTGTVSAGAYTAGVIDFFVEAMDAWYAERARQQQQFGDDYDRWSIPPHELQLAVMAGASGGGITAALAAAALTQTFDHIHSQRAAENSAWNTLFRSWVVDIDLKRLLAHADLDQAGGNVPSLLDSTPIRNIAAQAFQSRAALDQRRSWVRNGLKIVLTLTNLRGIPYAVEPQIDYESARTLYFADRQDFAVIWDGASESKNVLPLYPRGLGAWPQLADAAVATSAFPVVLAPQQLNRTAGEYNTRYWRIPKDDPKCGPDGVCICETNEPMPPAWQFSDNDSASFQTLNVDGGTTNNSPVDCVRLELASLDPVVTSGHNPRDPHLADRALINIAPLAADVAAQLPPPAQGDLLKLPLALIGLLLNQSRIQGENLFLSSDPTVASRWVISPTAEVHGLEPLAGGLMSAFGAFVSQILREHDYQLGRRNCQRFLTAYFGVPWDNVVLKQYAISQQTQERLDSIYGFAAQNGTANNGPQRLCPLIPVVPSLRAEIPVARNPIDRADLLTLADMAVDRVKRVAKALINQNTTGFIPGLGFDALWLLINGKLRDKLLTYAAYELSRQGFLN